MKKLLAVLLTTSIVFSAAGCGTPETASELRHLNITKTGTAAISNPIVEVAQAKGYLDEYNIDLSSTTLETTGECEAVSTGKVDASYNQVILPLSYGAQESDVTFFAGNISGGMYVVAREDEAEELKDPHNWKGKTIGVFQISTSEVASRYALTNNYGLVIGEDIEYKTVDDHANTILGLQKGTIDIGIVPSQYKDGLEASGLTVLFPETDLLPDYVCCRQYANTEKLEDERDLFKDYLKAQIKAYKDINTNEGETIDVLVKASGESEEYVYDYLYNKDANANRKNNPDPNYNGTLDVYNTLLEWDYLESDRNLNEFFDISIYADALKEIIDENPNDDFYQDMWTYFIEHNDSYPEFDDKYAA